MPATLVPVTAWWDVPAEWRETPVGEFVAYHSLARPLRRHDHHELLIGTCMDGRIALRLPEGFAYVLRTAGASLAPVAGNVSYVLGTKGIRHVVVLAHTGCGAVGLSGKRAKVVEGLVKNAGWDRGRAEQHFHDEVAPHGIDDPAGFAFREARWIEREYPRVKAVAMLYETGTGGLSLVRDCGAS